MYVKCVRDPRTWSTVIPTTSLKIVLATQIQNGEVMQMIKILLLAFCFRLLQKRSLGEVKRNLHCSIDSWSRVHGYNKCFTRSNLVEDTWTTGWLNWMKNLASPRLSMRIISELAISMARNHQFHVHTKHFVIKNYYIKEQVNNRRVQETKVLPNARYDCQRVNERS